MVEATGANYVSSQLHERVRVQYLSRWLMFQFESIDADGDGTKPLKHFEHLDGLHAC
jgi:hypothetical protein